MSPENDETKVVDDLFCSYLKDCGIGDGTIHGYLEDLETFNTIILAMKSMGYTYSVRDSDVRNRKAKNGKDNGSNESFEPEKHTVFYYLKAMPIQFFGLPFTVEKTTVYQCTFGCKYYKSKAERKLKAENLGHTLPVKKRRRVVSKKMGCLAKMILKKITVYPEYELNAIKDWRKKKSLIESLRKDLSSNEENVTKSCRYYLSVSMQSCHNHPPAYSIENIYPKTKRNPSYSPRPSAKMKKKQVQPEDTTIVTLYQAKDEEERVEIVSDDQDAQFFNSLVKFRASNIEYAEEKPVISIEMANFEMDSVPQEEDPTYQVETIHYAAVDLRNLVKEKLKRIFTLVESCDNTDVLVKIVNDLDQADMALLENIGYDPLE